MVNHSFYSTSDNPWRIVYVVAGSLAIHLMFLGLLPRIDFNQTVTGTRSISIAIVANDSLSKNDPLAESNSDETFESTTETAAETPQKVNDNALQEYTQSIDTSDESQELTGIDHSLKRENSNPTLADTQAETVSEKESETDVIVTEESNKEKDEGIEPVQNVVKDNSVSLEEEGELVSENSLAAVESTVPSNELLVDDTSVQSAPFAEQMETQETSEFSSPNPSSSEQKPNPNTLPVQPQNFRSAVFVGNKPKVVRPAIAKKRRLKGEVILRGLVSGEGVLSQVTVFQSSGHEVLDNAALEQAVTWQFQSARDANGDVDQWVQLPVVFQ